MSSMVSYFFTTPSPHEFRQGFGDGFLAEGVTGGVGKSDAFVARLDDGVGGGFFDPPVHSQSVCRFPVSTQRPYMAPKAARRMVTVPFLFHPGFPRDRAGSRKAERGCSQPAGIHEELQLWRRVDWCLEIRQSGGDPEFVRKATSFPKPPDAMTTAFLALMFFIFPLLASGKTYFTI